MCAVWCQYDHPDLGREELHYLNPVPIHDIAERRIGKFERHPLQALSELKKGLEARDD